MNNSRSEVDQMIWAGSFGAMMVLTIAVSILSFFPVQSRSARERSFPPELVAYLFFGCSFFIYALTVVDPFPITQWIPLLVGAAVCGLTAYCGGQLVQAEPIFPNAFTEAWSLSGIMTTSGILLAGAFYSQNSKQEQPASLLSWTPLLIVGYLIALGARFGSRLVKERSSAVLMDTKQLTILCSALGLYICWHFFRTSGEKVLDWAQYGNAVLFLAVGAFGGKVLAALKPTITTGHSAPTKARSTSRVGGAQKNRKYSDKAKPTRLLDHFDHNDVIRAEEAKRSAPVTLAVVAAEETVPLPRPSTPPAPVPAFPNTASESRNEEQDDVDTVEVKSSESKHELELSQSEAEHARECANKACVCGENCACGDNCACGTVPDTATTIEHKTNDIVSSPEVKLAARTVSTPSEKSTTPQRPASADENSHSRLQVEHDNRPASAGSSNKKNRSKRRAGKAIAESVSEEH